MAHVAILGAKELLKHFEKEKGKVSAARDAGMRTACELLVGHIKKSMVETKRTQDESKAWKKGKGKQAKLHFPSISPHPPAVDESNLIKSIRYEIKKGKKDEVLGHVGSMTGVPYAAALEYGRLDGHIAPRPWLRPALTRNVERITKIFMKVLSG